jgi:hypothetical protein
MKAMPLSNQHGLFIPVRHLKTHNALYFPDEQMHENQRVVKYRCSCIVTIDDVVTQSSDRAIRSTPDIDTSINIAFIYHDYSQPCWNAGCMTASNT